MDGTTIVSGLSDRNSDAEGDDNDDHWYDEGEDDFCAPVVLGSGLKRFWINFPSPLLTWREVDEPLLRLCSCQTSLLCRLLATWVVWPGRWISTLSFWSIPLLFFLMLMFLPSNPFVLFGSLILFGFLVAAAVPGRRTTTLVQIKFWIIYNSVIVTFFEIMLPTTQIVGKQTPSWPQIIFDSVLLQFIIENLLNGAVEYLQKRHIRRMHIVEDRSSLARQLDLITSDHPEFIGLVELPGTKVSSGHSYYPLLPSKPTSEHGVTHRNLSRDAIEEENPVLFIHCECCLDVEATRATLVAPVQEWLHEPGASRQIDPYPSVITDSGHTANIENPATSFVGGLDRLCDVCRAICRSSCVLQRGWDDAISTSWARWRVRQREVFWHSTPTYIRDFAGSKCHLCTLIWTSLSMQQQNSLIEEETNARNLLDEAIASAPSISSREAMKQRFQSSHGVRIALEALNAQVPASIDGPDPKLLWKHAPEVQLIPHFGGYRRARKWMTTIESHETLVFDENGRYTSPLYVFVSEPPPYGQLPSGDFFTFRHPWYDSASTGSATAVQFIKKCLEKHRPPLSPDSIPNRLIDLTNYDNGTIQIKSRADIMEGEGLYPQYVTLSSCSRTNDNFALNDSTRDFFMSPCDVAVFPQLYQDAISVCHQAGFDYLWIRSLCIDQGDAFDLDTELSTRYEIFSQAAFTIVVTSGNTINQGIFRPENQLSHAPCMLKSSIYALPSQLNDLDRDKQLEIDLSPWNCSAQTLSDRAFSTRCLYFCLNQIHFESSAFAEVRSASQSHRYKSLQDEENTFEGDFVYSGAPEPPEDVVYSQYEWKHGITPKKRYALLHAGNSSDLTDNRKWWNYVQSLTQRNFEDDTDRKQAASALAMFFQNSGARMMLADWQESFDETSLTSLLWYAQSLKGDRLKESPAWSWSAAHGIISNDSVDAVALETSGVRFIGIYDTSSRMLSGSRDAHFAAGRIADRSCDTFIHALPEGFAIHLAGRLNNGSWKRVPNQYYVARRKLHQKFDIREFGAAGGNYESRNAHLRNAYPQLSSDPSSGPACHQMQCNCGKTIGLIVPDGDDELPEQLYFLRIVVRLPYANSENPWESKDYIRLTRGIALRKLDEAMYGRNTFSRVGYFELTATSPTEHWNQVQRRQLLGRARAGVSERALQVTDLDVPWRIVSWNDIADLDPHGFFSSHEADEIQRYDHSVLANVSVRQCSSRSTDAALDANVVIL